MCIRDRMKTVVQAGQTLLDIAVQEYGTIEAVFMLAKANDMSITDTLQACLLYTSIDYSELVDKINIEITND